MYTVLHFLFPVVLETLLTFVWFVTTRFHEKNLASCAQKCYSLCLLPFPLAACWQAKSRQKPTVDIFFCHWQRDRGNSLDNRKLFSYSLFLIFSHLRKAFDSRKSGTRVLDDEKETARSNATILFVWEVCSTITGLDQRGGRHLLVYSYQVIY